MFPVMADQSSDFSRGIFGGLVLLSLLFHPERFSRSSLQSWQRMTLWADICHTVDCSVFVTVFVTVLQPPSVL